MFSTTIHRRPSIQPLVPLLYSHEPPFKARPFQTHDLALPIRYAPSLASPSNVDQTQTPEQQRPLAPPPTPPIYQLFLLVTPSDLSPTQEAATLERISRFSTLTAMPTPVIAMTFSNLSPSVSTTFPAAGQSIKSANSPSETMEQQQGMQAYLHLQTLLHFPPPSSSSSSPSSLPFTHPPPIIPIPSLSSLLPLLKAYSASLLPPSSPTPTLPSTSPLHLLPLLTPKSPTSLLKPHTVNVLSDLCHSLREVAWICERDEGRMVVGEWLGVGEGQRLTGFFSSG